MSSAVAAAAHQSPHHVTAALQSLLASLASLSTHLALPRPPRLVAVSKTKPAKLVEECMRAGQRHFGENYVAELVEKAAVLASAASSLSSSSSSPSSSSSSSSPLCWHMIGHLQTNKCRTLVRQVPSLYMVESIDSQKLARELNKQVQSAWGDALKDGSRSPLRVLVQVNTSGEGSKSGCAPDEAEALFLFLLRSCAALDVRGLMTIGAAENTERSAKEAFRRLREVREQLLAKEEVRERVSTEQFEMSMGMSGDWQIAVAEGSTNVRVGSTIFGSRDYSKEMKDYAQHDAQTEEVKEKEGEGKQEEKKQ